MAIKTGSTLYLLKIFSFAWYGEFKLLFKKNKIQRGLTLLRWLLARWLCDHVRRGIVLKAYRCFFSQQLSAYLSNKYWAAWLSWRISWRKQRAENFLLKFATDSFPGLTSRVSLFNVNVLNHKDKLSVKTVQIKFRMYSQWMVSFPQFLTLLIARVNVTLELMF